MYAVLIITPETNGTEEVSRFFETLRAARRWARVCQKFSSSVRILKGGAGGMPVV